MGGGGVMYPLGLALSCAVGMPVVHSGHTVPSQASLCFDPGNPASDRTEGKKKGRPKAENQALRDIPVSSLRVGLGGAAHTIQPVKATALPLPTHNTSCASLFQHEAKGPCI